MRVFTLGTIQRNRQTIPVGSIAEFTKKEGDGLIARGIVREATKGELDGAHVFTDAPSPAKEVPAGPTK